jgi:sporulation protein YlmC with PRC-barrel domain
MPDLPRYEVAGQVLDVNLHILDRQVLDNDDVPIGHVDDIEIDGVERGRELVPDSPPVITNLVLNSGILPRIFGGRPPHSRLHRVPWRTVTAVGTAIELGEPGSAFDVTWPERWVRDHVIARIPGGRHAPE